MGLFTAAKKNDEYLIRRISEDASAQDSVELGVDIQDKVGFFKGFVGKFVGEIKKVGKTINNAKDYSYGLGGSTFTAMLAMRDGNKIHTESLACGDSSSYILVIGKDGKVRQEAKAAEHDIATNKSEFVRIMTLIARGVDHAYLAYEDGDVYKGTIASEFKSLLKKFKNVKISYDGKEYSSKKLSEIFKEGFDPEKLEISYKDKNWLGRAKGDVKTMGFSDLCDHLLKKIGSKDLRVGDGGYQPTRGFNDSDVEFDKARSEIVQKGEIIDVSADERAFAVSTSDGTPLNERGLERLEQYIKDFKAGKVKSINTTLKKLGCSKSILKKGGDLDSSALSTLIALSSGYYNENSGLFICAGFFDDAAVCTEELLQGKLVMTNVDDGHGVDQGENKFDPEKLTSRKVATAVGKCFEKAKEFMFGKGEEVEISDNWRKSVGSEKEAQHETGL